MLFAKISFEAIESIRDPEMLAVYVGLMRFARFRNGGSTYTNGVWVSDTKLAEMLGMDVDTVTSSLCALQTLGWIDWATDDDDERKYVVNFVK